jgi:tetratricopeptide (TPR) repeat protein
VQPLQALLIERTEGNPFFLEEAVRTLVESRVLTGERGAYRVANPVAQIQDPTTVQAVLAARIDRLPPDEKRLLQAAAVVGKDVPYAVLLAIADRPEVDLRRDLAHLQAAEFLYETRLVPDLEYTFKHALTHDVAYESLLQERRRHLHARIVDAIEQFFPGRLAEQIERLAHHAVRGEVWDRAVTYLRQAGAKAAARSAYREAMTYFEDALLALERLPRTPETMAQTVDLRFDLRNCQGPLGVDPKRMLDNLRAAEGVANELGDQRRLGWVAAHIANVSWAMGEYEPALAAARRTLATANALEDPALAVVARFRLGQSYATQGEYRRAIEVLGGDTLDRATHASPGHAALPFLPGAALRTWLAMCHAELGEFADGAVHAQEGLRLAEGANHAVSVMVACLGVGRLRLAQGDLAGAIPVLERGLDLSRLSTTWAWLPRLGSALGAAYMLASRLPEALPLLEMAVVRSDATKVPETQSLHPARFGEACLLAGRAGEAASVGQRALELSRRHGERGHEAWSLRLLAELAARVDPLDGETAERRFQQALALATELGMRTLVAHCHLGVGKLYRRTGDGAKSDKHLTTATTMYREMGMAFWLEKAEAASLEG